MAPQLIAKTHGAGRGSGQAARLDWFIPLIICLALRFCLVRGGLCVKEPLFCVLVYFPIREMAAGILFDHFACGLAFNAVVNFHVFRFFRGLDLGRFPLANFMRKGPVWSGQVRKVLLQSLTQSCK